MTQWILAICRWHLSRLALPPSTSFYFELQVFTESPWIRHTIVTVCRDPKPQISDFSCQNSSQNCSYWIASLGSKVRPRLLNPIQALFPCLSQILSPLLHPHPELRELLVLPVHPVIQRMASLETVLERNIVQRTWRLNWLKFLFVLSLYKIIIWWCDYLRIMAK